MASSLFPSSRTLKGPSDERGLIGAFSSVRTLESRTSHLSAAAALPSKESVVSSSRRPGCSTDLRMAGELRRLSDTNIEGKNDPFPSQATVVSSRDLTEESVPTLGSNIRILYNDEWEEVIVERYTSSGVVCLFLDDEDGYSHTTGSTTMVRSRVIWAHASGNC